MDRYGAVGACVPPQLFGEDWCTQHDLPRHEHARRLFRCGSSDDKGGLASRWYRGSLDTHWYRIRDQHLARKGRHGGYLVMVHVRSFMRRGSFLFFGLFPKPFKNLTRVVRQHYIMNFNKIMWASTSHNNSDIISSHP
jgi:hypothetical protein